MIHEINSSDWPAFCERISEQRSGARVKLEVIEPDGVKTERVADGGLQSMIFDDGNACSDTIVLRITDAREVVHEIIEPIRIRLHPSNSAGDFHTIEIEAESGISIITLTPSIHAQMLEELKAR
jgi:hypothetical protein